MSNERARAGGGEPALCESEKYRQLVDFIPAAVYACSADGTLDYYNARAVELWGREPEVNDGAWTLCGSWRTYLPDGTLLKPAESPMASVLATGEPVVNRELKIERPDGSLIDILININPLRDPAGNVTGAVSIFQDNTDRKRAEQALCESEARLEGQKEAFLAAIHGAPLEASLDILIRTVTKLAGDEVRAAFYIVDPDGTCLHPVSTAGGMPESYASRVDGFKIGLDSLACGLAVAAGVPVITRDVFDEPRWAPWLHLARDFGFCACWSFPMETRSGKSVGTLAMYHREPRAATQRDLLLANAVTQAAAILISRDTEVEERKRAEEAVAADLSDTRLLHELATRLVDEGDIQSLCEQVLAAAMALMHSDGGSVRLLDEAKQELVLIAAAGMLQSVPDRLLRVDASPNTSRGVALGKGERIYMDFDLSKSADPDGTHRIHREAGLASAQATPLIARLGKPIGMLSTHWRKHHRPSERELRFLDLLARQAADLLARAHTEEALRGSEERFRLLVEGARDYAMFLLDPENRITYWSVGAERLFGWTEAEAMGQNAALIFTPEDRERGEPEKEWHTALHEGRAEDIRWHLRKDGSHFWADGLLMRLDDEGRGFRGFAKVTRDATERKQAEEALQEALEALARANEQLEQRVEERTHALLERTEELAAMSELRQELLLQLVTAQEQERGHIARDLHDDTGQQVTGLLLGLDRLIKSPATVDPALRETLDQLQALAGDVAEKSYRLAVTLRPIALDDLGLVSALTQYTQEWGRWSGVPVEVEAIGLEARLPQEIETTIYRVTQEALTNVLRHARDSGESRATRVSVLVQRRANEVLTVIEDGGPGFDVEAALSLPPGQRRLGIFGMQERARLAGGTLTIESKPGEGTTVSLRLPLPAEGAPDV